MLHLACPLVPMDITQAPTYSRIFSCSSVYVVSRALGVCLFSFILIS